MESCTHIDSPQRSPAPLPLECYKEVVDSLELGCFTISLVDPYRIDLFGQAAAILRANGDETTLERLLGLDGSRMAALEKWLKIVERLHRVQEWAKLTHIAPLQKLTIQISETQAQVLQFTYKKICDGQGNLGKILVQITDITEGKRKEEKLEAEIHFHENEVRTILTVANTPHEELLMFLIDTDARIDKLIRIIYEQRESLLKRGSPETSIPLEVIERVDAIFNETIFRDLHTIKGNAGTYGFAAIAEQIHTAESLVIQLQPSQALKRSSVLEEIANRLQNCKKEIEYIKSIMARLFGKEDSIAVRIPKERIEKIQQLCNQLIDSPHPPTVTRLIEQCMTLSWRPLSTLTRKYHRIVQTRAELLGKDVEFTVENGHALWPADIFQSLDDSITHIVANAVTHGIESKKTRYEQNKGRGAIRFALERREGMLSVRIADDGEGINTAELVKRSVEKGIIPAEMAGTLNEIQKLELIFAQGITTAESLTELSGRGVGMDVVREQIRMLDGTISIFSETGRGTTFTLRIPCRQIPDDPFGQDTPCEWEEER